MDLFTVHFNLIFFSTLCFGSAVDDHFRDVSFSLFTRINPKSGQLLKINDTEVLKTSNFNSEWPVRIIIHGWQASNKSDLNIIIRDGYLKKSDFNVIIVDWSVYSLLLYIYAHKHVEPVGNVVAHFTKFLQNEGVAFDDMYLIGHSLGAHISGIAGYKIAPEQYNTIFALDPARPEFETAPPSGRIDPTDAKYVESIQTDTAFLGVGMIQPVGKASFFPNQFLLEQPGCITISCSHVRSTVYFAESINSPIGFFAKACWSCREYFTMGGEPSTPKSGVFNLSTNSKAPYAKGKM